MHQTPGEVAYKRREAEKLGSWLKYVEAVTKARRELMIDIVESEEQQHASSLIGKGRPYDAPTFAMIYQTTHVGDVVGFVHKGLMKKELQKPNSILICGWLWHASFQADGADMSRIHHFNDVITGKSGIDMQKVQNVCVVDDINYRADQQDQTQYSLLKSIYQALLPQYDDRFTHVEFLVFG